MKEPQIVHLSPERLYRRPTLDRIPEPELGRGLQEMALLLPPPDKRKPGRSGILENLEALVSTLHQRPISTPEQLIKNRPPRPLSDLLEPSSRPPPQIRPPPS